MECFNNQIYKLCDANGNEHTNFCHDLEIGPKGLIVYRSSTNNNNDWEIKKYYKTYGLKNFEQKFIDDIEYECHYFNGCAEFYGQDLLSIENNKLFYFEKNKKRQNDLSHLNILRFLNSDSFNKENFWYCAPWIIKLYNNDEYLAYCAIKKDYRIYNLLNNKQKSKPKIKNQFLKHTSFEYALVIIEFKKIKKILWQNKSICYNWLNDSHIVYMLMNDNFKNEKKFIFLLAKRHPDYFYLIPKNKYLDENLIKDCLSVNGSILKTLPYSLKNNFEIVLQAVMQDYTSLEYASYRLKNSKEAILKFIKINPKTIHFASNKIKKMKFFLNFKSLNTNKINNNDLKNNLKLPF